MKGYNLERTKLVLSFLMFKEIRILVLKFQKLKASFLLFNELVILSNSSATAESINEFLKIYHLQTFNTKFIAGLASKNCSYEC